MFAMATLIALLFKMFKKYEQKEILFVFQFYTPQVIGGWFKFSICAICLQINTGTIKMLHSYTLTKN